MAATAHLAGPEGVGDEGPVDLTHPGRELVILPGGEQLAHLGEFAGTGIGVEALDRPEDIEQLSRDIGRSLRGALLRARDAQLNGRIFQSGPSVGFELPETVVRLGVRNRKHGDTSVDDAAAAWVLGSRCARPGTRSRSPRPVRICESVSGRGVVASAMSLPAA